MTVDAILNERGSRYGNYLMQATIAESMWSICVDALQNKEIAADQANALHMICTKIARIVNGPNPNHIDSWNDIAGYALLVAERLEGKTR
jgi:hypothetical protein